MKMRVIGLILTMLISYQTYGQSKITGRILDYDSGIALSSVTVFLKDNSNITGASTDKNGYFVIDSIKQQSQATLVIHYLTHEKLFIKNIELIENQNLDIGTIHLVEGTYLWDGECTTKLFFGLIKIKRSCGGTNKGLIHKNKGKDSVNIKYPKDGHELTFDIVNDHLEIDFQNLTKHNKP